MSGAYLKVVTQSTKRHALSLLAVLRLLCAEQRRPCKQISEMSTVLLFIMTLITTHPPVTEWEGHPVTGRAGALP